MTAPVSKNTKPNAAPVCYQAESYALVSNQSIGHETKDKWDAQTPFCTGSTWLNVRVSTTAVSDTAAQFNILNETA